MRRPVFAAIVLIALDACELVLDPSSVQSGNADAATDAAVNNLLVNGDFEEGAAGCGPGWSTDGIMTRSSVAHSGGWSCELCGLVNGSATLTATPAPSVHLTSESTYYAQAWVKIEDAGSLAQVALDLEEQVQGGTTLAYKQGNVSSTAWQPLQAGTYAAKDGGWGITFMIHANGIEGGVPGCVLIDDVQLIAQ